MKDVINKIFKFRKANFEKLKKFGFELIDGKFQYETSILEGDFRLFVFVTKNDDVSTQVVDVQSQEEYVLHLMENSVGEFVGKVRTEVENVLVQICDNCFDKEIFKSEQAKDVIDYISKKFGVKLEFLWEKFPNNAIWRRKDNSKWFALIVNLPKNKLGVKSDEMVDVLDLRIMPEKIHDVVDKVSIFEAYHMNKKHWFAICLDGSVSNEKIYQWINESFDLALK